MDKILVSRDYLEMVAQALKGDEYCIESARSNTRYYLNKPKDDVTILKMIMDLCRMLLNIKLEEKKKHKRWV